MSHSNALPSFEILAISSASDGNSQLTWSSMRNASKYRVDLTNDKNCATKNLSLTVTDTSVTISAQTAIGGLVKYACVVALDQNGKQISAAKNNPFLLSQSTTTTNSVSTSSSPTASNSSVATSITKSLTSTNSFPPFTLQMVYGDSNATSCLPGLYGIGGPAKNAFLPSSGVFTDSSGHIYLPDSTNNVVLMIPKTSGTYFGKAMTAGSIYIVAGVGAVGGSSAVTTGVMATSNNFDVYNSFVDRSGNIYLMSNNYLYMVPFSSGTFWGQAMTSGFVYMIAGTGTLGAITEGALATSSKLGLSNFSSMSVDPSGNIFILDYLANRFYMIAASTGTYFGISMTSKKIYTIAGQGAIAAASGLSGTAVYFINNPDGLSFDSNGNVFFKNAPGDGTNAIYIVAKSTNTFYGVSMTAGHLYALLSSNTDDLGLVNVDTSGNIFYTDSTENNSILMIYPASTGTSYGISTVADVPLVFSDGTGSVDPCSTATLSGVIPSQLNSDLQNGMIASDIAGNLVVQTGNGGLLFMPASSGAYFGTSMSAGYFYRIGGQSGPATQYVAPVGSVAASAPIWGGGGNFIVDSNGVVFFNDGTFVSPTGGTFFGQSAAPGVLEQGTYTAGGGSCDLMALDIWRNMICSPLLWLSVYPNVAGTFYGDVMPYGTLTTITTGGSIANGVALSNFGGDWFDSIAVDSVGNVAVSLWSSGNYYVFIIPVTLGTYFGQAMTANHAYLMAGTGTNGTSGVGGVSTAAQLLYPGAIAFDSYGNMIISDDNRILVIAAKTGTFWGQAMTVGHLYVVAGSPTDVSGKSPSGTALSSSILNCTDFCGVAVDAIGSLYISDYNNNRILMAPQVTGTYFGQAMTANTLNCIAGCSTSTFNAGYSAPGTLASQSLINHPHSIGIDGHGNVYFGQSTSYMEIISGN